MAGKHRRFYDYTLAIAVIFMTALGLMMIYSVLGISVLNVPQNENETFFQMIRHNRFLSQVMYAVFGIVIMLIVSVWPDYHFYGYMSVIIIPIAYLLQTLTFIMGVASHGQARWLNLAGGSLQPSELVKIAVIIGTGSMVANLGKGINEYKKSLWCFMLLGALPALLIVGSNLSTAIIVFGINMVMLFVATDFMAIYLLLAGFAALIVIYAYPIAKFLENIGLVKQYRLERIFAWKMPDVYRDIAFQTRQGLFAIGSGGLRGVGLGASVQKYRIPEAQNDMIFTIICEETGFIGAISILLLYSLIIYRLFEIARNARDLFGSMLVTGIMAHISIQVILNIAVVTNVFPNTGVTLPFISAGGSALIATLGEIGIALNVSGKTVLYQGEGNDRT